MDRRPRSIGRGLLLWGALALVALLALPAVAGAAELRLSLEPDRQSWTVLEGADLSGSVYIHVSPSTGPTAVRFWLDDPDRTGLPRKTEFGAPWDFAGTASGGLANPFDSTTVANDTHVVTAEVDVDGGTEVLNATFTVSNPFPPDQVHLSWAGDPATTFTAVWRTTSPATPSSLQYRQAGSLDWIDVTGAIRPSGTPVGRLNEATAGPLLPATEYQYRVLGDGGQWSSAYSTRTAPQGSASFDAVFVADTGIAGRPDGLAAGTQPVIDAIHVLDPLVLLLGGDYAHHAGDARFSTGDAAIDAWFAQEQLLLRRTPGMPTYGEREEVFEDHDAWAARFPTPSGHDSGRFYSFDVGNAHFISILAAANPYTLPQATLEWLQQDIDDAQARGQQWIVPYMHQSPFSSGQSHGSNFDLRNQLGPLFEQEQIKLVLSAHDESYERTYPLSNLGAGNNPTSSSLSCYGPADGVTWVKTSPGGKLLSGGGFSTLTQPKPYWSAVRDNTRHHFTRVRVFGDSLRVEAWGVAGDGSPPVLVDSFQIRSDPCMTLHPRPGSATPLRVPLVPLVRRVHGA